MFLSISHDMCELTKSKIGFEAFGTIKVRRLHTLGINVAIKQSKDCSLNVEGRVYQALSGHKNFLLFFGMLDNAVVMELVSTFDANKCCFIGSTVKYGLEQR